MERKRAAKWLVSLATFIAVAPIVAPQLLAFPYHARSGTHEVWSESPLPATDLARVLQRSDALTRSGGFGLTYPGIDAVILNRSDLAADRIFSVRYGQRFGGIRLLSGVITHETAHGMIRKRYGLIASMLAPTMIVEGYCDYVAQEGSLSDADAAELDRTGQSHPALIYYHGRKRIAAALAANGGSVDKLFVDAAEIAAAKSNQN